mgnify:CR=1 FL=1
MSVATVSYELVVLRMPPLKPTLKASLVIFFVLWSFVLLPVIS